MTVEAKAGKGSGKRRRFKGRMVQSNGLPRSHTHGGHSPAFGGWSCGDVDVAPRDQATKHMPGRFKVGPPRKRQHRRGFYRSIGEAV